MLGSSHLSHLAAFRVAAWLFATALCGVAYPPEGHGKQDGGGTHERTQQRRLNNPRLYEPNCQEPKSTEEADLCAQREMAVAARDLYDISVYQLLVGVFGLGGLLATLIFTARAARAAADAARAAEKDVAANTRFESAFIVVEPPSSAPTPFLTVAIVKLHNFGRTAALPLEWAYTRVGMIGRETTFNVKEPMLGTVILPNNHETKDVVVPREEQVGNQFIVGHVIYEDVLSRIWETGFAFDFRYPTHGVSRAGGKQYNYTREITDEYASRA